MSLLSTLRALALSAVFPPQCIRCGKEADFFCEECLSSLPRLSSYHCPSCNGRVPRYDMQCHPKEKFLLASPLSFENEGVRELIHLLKFGGMRHAASPLNSCLIPYLVSLPLPNMPWTVVPIPLHWKRKLIRGYNQAEELAAAIAAHFAFPLEARLLVRARATLPQTAQQDFRARRENLKDSFCTRANIPVPSHCLLVDDVYTSGATMREAVRALKRAGTKNVLAITAAKT